MMSAKEKKETWTGAQGLLQADGVQPSPEMQQLIQQEIDGEISTADIKANLDALFAAAVPLEPLTPEEDAELEADGFEISWCDPEEDADLISIAEERLARYGLNFESSLSIEEIEANFKDVDVFSGVMAGLKEALAYEADPLYSKSNQAYLEQTIADIEAGREKLVEHDLIEV